MNDYDYCTRRHWQRNDETKTRNAIANEECMHQPETVVPQCFSTPSTAAAIAFPFSAALSKRAIASYKHFAMSSNAITSPFSTTGRCLNFPVENDSMQQMRF